jgi:hypothetical protein
LNSTSPAGLADERGDAKGLARLDAELLPAGAMMA